jgi:hypothetical protein
MLWPIFGVIIMKKDKVSVLCGGNNKPFTFSEAHGIASWIVSTFNDLTRVEIYETNKDFKWVLVLICDDIDIRNMFIEDFCRSKTDASNAQKRFAAIEMLGNRRSSLKASATFPFVDALVFPNDWRKSVLKLSEDYSSSDLYVDTCNYFEKLALQDPVEVL